MDQRKIVRDAAERTDDARGIRRGRAARAGVYVKSGLRSRVDGYDVFRLGAFRALADGKFDELPLFQGAVAFRLDGAVVDKDVLRAFTLDEPEALRVVEPFDFAFFAFAHVLPSICCSRGVVEQTARASGTADEPSDGMHAGALCAGRSRYMEDVSCFSGDNYTSK